jgi:hypothetical protein
MERIHKLKTWPTYYDAIAAGEKNFEVRKNDRAFQKGELVELIRTESDGSGYYGTHPQTMTFRIGWLLQGGQFGIEPGYCVLSLLPYTTTKEGA